MKILKKYFSLCYIYKQLKKYNLLKNVTIGWIYYLNSRQKNNLTKLDFSKYNEYLSSDIILNSKFLNSIYYIHDIELISNHIDKRQTLFDVATSKTSLNSGHHEDDMKRICETKTLEKAEAYASFFKNEMMSKSKYYNDYLKAIDQADETDKLAFNLFSTVSFYPYYLYVNFANNEDDEALIENFNFMEYYDFINKVMNSKGKISLETRLMIYEQCMQDIYFLRNARKMQDLELMENASSINHLEYLAAVSTSEDALQFKNYENAINLIANTESHHRARFIKNILCERKNTIGDFFRQSKCSFNCREPKDLLINIAASTKMESALIYMNTIFTRLGFSNYKFSLLYTFILLSKAKNEKEVNICKDLCCEDDDRKICAAVGYLLDISPKNLTIDSCRYYIDELDIPDIINAGKEQEQNFLERKSDIKEEISILESAVDEEKKLLNTLDSMGNETESNIDDDLAYESLLENYLNERIDYSKVHLDDIAVDQVKLNKKYN